MSKYAMERRQKGFTLVEIAIVLVIIGLLLGGVLKGQELINSAKVKNFATDFRNIPLYIYGYQDKYKALPGDDRAAEAHLGAGNNPAQGANPPAGNGMIDGNWDSIDETHESVIFWQHVRLAGLASGATVIPASLTANDAFFPTNADGGRIGIESGSSKFISGLQGAYVVCSQGILGKFAKQLDVTMDDGVTNTGSMRTVTLTHTRLDPAPAPNTIDDATAYTVCMGL